MQSKIKRYFKKVKKGKMTVSTAAKQIGCSEDQFECEYKRYYDPFKYQKKESSAFVISAISLMISFGTLMASWDANRLQILSELKIEDGMVSLYWDSEGRLIYGDTNMLREEVPDEEFLITQPTLTLRNLGKGTAKNLVYDWKYEDNLFDYEMKLDGRGHDIEIVEEEEKRLTVKDNGETINTYYIPDDTNSYLITETETQLTIPRVYMDMLALYCDDYIDENGGEFDYEDDEYGFARISMKIHYEDVDDSPDFTNINVRFNPIVYREFDDGSRGCTFILRTS